IILHEFLYLSV
ncbi:unnamed protein product, partial [Leptidea sinapis]